MTDYNEVMKNSSDVEQIRQESVMREYHRRQRLRDQQRDPVKVQLMTLQEVPEPLSKHEFGEICRQEGLPVLGGHISPLSINETTLEDLAREQKRQQEQTRWQNTLSNLFGAYMAMYDLFRKWHQDIVEDRNVVGPVKQKHYGGRISAQKRKLLQWKDDSHYQRHRKLVNVLIEYGLGFGQAENEQQQNHLGHYKTVGPDQWKTHQKAASRSISPQQVFAMSNVLNSKTHRELYGPVANLSMVEEQMLAKREGSLKVYAGPHDEVSQKESLQATDIKSAEEDGVSICDSSSSSLSKQQQRRSSLAKQESIFDQSQKSATQQLLGMGKQPVSMRATFKEGHYSSNNLLSVQEFDALNYSRKQDKRRGKSLYAQSPKAKPLAFDSASFHCPNNQKLVRELTEMREKLKKAEAQVVIAKNSNYKVISKYIQEDSNRKINLSSISTLANEQAEMIKTQIESRFFNITDGLEPQIVKILNAKIAQIRDVFVGQINTMNYHADGLQQKVALLERINADGLKFKDLDTEKLIDKLSQVEKLQRNQNFKLRKIDQAAKVNPTQDRPKVIWTLLNKYFGLDYFMEVIEEDYGIAPGHDDQLSVQIQKHFEGDLETLKKEHMEKEEHFRQQVGKLRDEIQELVSEKTQLMRRGQRDHEKMKQENQKYAKLLVESAKEQIERRYRKSVNEAQKRVEEMSNNLKGKTRSHMSMQLNYGWKRWLMFTKIKKVLSSMEKTERTGIDNKMLEIAEQFVREDFLIMFYSRKQRRNADGVLENVTDPLPGVIVKDYLIADANGQLKSQVIDLNHKLKHNIFLIQDYEQNIQDYQCQVQDLRLRQTELKLHVPALVTQNKLLQETLLAKEEECRKLDEQVQNIESRWKSNAREGYKITAKSIMAALQLKSLNEKAAHKYRSTKTVKWFRRNFSNQQTITTICNLTFPLLERIPYVDKEIQKDMEVQDAGVGDHDYRQWNVASGKQRLMALKTIANQTEMHQDDAKFVESGTSENIQDPAVLYNHSQRRSIAKSVRSIMSPQTTPNVNHLKEYQIQVRETQKLNTSQQMLQGSVQNNRKIQNFADPALRITEEHQDFVSRSKPPSLSRQNTQKQIKSSFVKSVKSISCAQSDKQQPEDMKLQNKQQSAESPLALTMIRNGLGRQSQQEIPTTGKPVIGMLKRQNTMKSGMLRSEQSKKHGGSHSASNMRESVVRLTQKLPKNRDILGTVTARNDRASFLNRSRSESQKSKQKEKTIKSKRGTINNQLPNPSNLARFRTINDPKTRQSSAGRSKNRDIKVPPLQHKTMNKFQSTRPKMRKHVQKKQNYKEEQVVGPAAQSQMSLKKIGSMKNIAEKQVSQLSMQLAKHNTVGSVEPDLREQFASPLSRAEFELPTTVHHTINNEESQEAAQAHPQLFLNSQFASFSGNMDEPQSSISFSQKKAPQQQPQNDLRLISLQSSSLPNGIAGFGIVDDGSPLHKFNQQTPSQGLIIASKKPKILITEQHLVLGQDSPSIQFEGQALAGTSSIFAHMQPSSEPKIDEIPPSPTLPDQMFGHLEQINSPAKLTALSKDICSESSQLSGYSSKKSEDSMCLLPVIKIEDLNKKRLSLVREHDQEQRNVSSPVSSDRDRNKSKTATRKSEPWDKQQPIRHETDGGDHITDNYIEPITEEIVTGFIPPLLQQRHQSENQHHLQRLNLPYKVPKSKKSRKSLGQNQQLMQHTSFGTSDDSSKYSARVQSRLGSSPSKSNVIKQPETQPALITDYLEEEKDIITATKLNSQKSAVPLSMIQKLLVKGFINEEQFLCLQLLEKGFIPASPSTGMEQTPMAVNNDALVTSKMSRNSLTSYKGLMQTTRFSRDPMMRTFNTQKTGFMTARQGKSMSILSQGARSSCRSHSPTKSQQNRPRSQIRSKHKCPNMQYRICANNIKVLETIFDRAYTTKQTKTKGVQCDSFILLPTLPENETYNGHFFEGPISPRETEVKLPIGKKQATKPQRRSLLKPGYQKITSAPQRIKIQQRQLMPIDSDLQVEGMSQEKVSDFSSHRNSAHHIFNEQMVKQMPQRALHAQSMLAVQAQTHSQYLAGATLMLEPAPFQQSQKRLLKRQKVLKLKLNKNMTTAAGTSRTIKSPNLEITEPGMQSNRFSSRSIFTPPPRLSQQDENTTQARSHKLIVTGTFPQKYSGRNTVIAQPQVTIM